MFRNPSEFGLQFSSYEPRPRTLDNKYGGRGPKSIADRFPAAPTHFLYGCIHSYFLSLAPPDAPPAGQLETDGADENDDDEDAADDDDDDDDYGDDNEHDVQCDDEDSGDDGDDDDDDVYNLDSDGD